MMASELAGVRLSGRRTLLILAVCAFALLAQPDDRQHNE
jgi:hypothetical protein